MNFSNKVVLITGASSGIGATCALMFAKTSASLCLIGRNADNIIKIAKKCEELSDLKPLVVLADLTIEDDVQKIVNDTINRYGKIDVLINNAGILAYDGMQSEMEVYDKIMATNLRGTYNLTRKIIPYLIKTQGNIINLSSILSFTPVIIMTPYCVSKAAIDMLTKCLAMELGPKGVRVNAVNPGPVETDIFKRSGMTDDITSKMFSTLKNNTPLGRVSSPEDVINLVMFLASDKASSITGCCHSIDCGLSLNNFGKLF